MIRTAILVVLLLGVSAVAATPDEQRAFAVEQAREHVPAAMKNPRSAEFDETSVEAVPIVEWGPPGWLRVSGIVRGTNAFNAVVPNRWSAYVTELDGKPALGVIMLGDTLVHAGPQAKPVLEQMERMARERKEKAEAALAAQRAKADADQAAAKAQRMQEADAIRTQIAERRQAKADAEETRRVAQVRNRGRRDGFAAVNTMGRAKTRLTDAEAAKRAKRAATQAKIPADDVEAYVDGWLSGAATAKAGQLLTN